MRAWLAVLTLLPLAAQQAPEPPADPGRPVLKRGGAAQERDRAGFLMSMWMSSPGRSRW